MWVQPQGAMAAYMAQSTLSQLNWPSWILVLIRLWTLMVDLMSVRSMSLKDRVNCRSHTKGPLTLFLLSTVMGTTNVAPCVTLTSTWTKLKNSSLICLALIKQSMMDSQMASQCFCNRRVQVRHWLGMLLSSSTLKNTLPPRQPFSKSIWLIESAFLMIFQVKA